MHKQLGETSLKDQKALVVSEDHTVTKSCNRFLLIHFWTYADWGAMICLVPAFLPLIFVMHQEPAAVLPSALIGFSKS